MNTAKLLLSEDLTLEAGHRLEDMLYGCDSLSAMFEDPYLDEVLAAGDEDELDAPLH